MHRLPTIPQITLRGRIAASLFLFVFFGVFIASPASGQATAGQLIISEFRVNGFNGPNDEFIEIYNASGSDHTVIASSGSGYGIAASDGALRCSIPNGTVIPNRGHYLCVNSVGYSLSNYGGTGAAAGDATYTSDIPLNAGIALFNTNVPGSFILTNRLDAVGSTSESNTLYKEGAGYPAITALGAQPSFYRDNCGKQGSISNFASCTTTLPRDTDNNAADFVWIDTNGWSVGAGQRLGAPGPENRSSPINRTSSLPASLIFPCVSASASPNRVRDMTPGDPNTSSLGTLEIRRKYTNNTGGNVTRLRFRITDITTFPADPGVADLRPITSTVIVVTDPCTGSAVLIQGTTLEQPPAQPNGGGFNSTMSAGTITLASPLANGASVNFRFVLGVQQSGNFRFNLNIEALP